MKDFNFQMVWEDVITQTAMVNHLCFPYSTFFF